MPSHLSSIGLPIHSQEEFIALAERVAARCEPIEVCGGRYLHWSSGCGAELWLQLDEENDLVGLNPHFAGPSVVRVGLTARVVRPGAAQMDGGFQGWADPSGLDPETGCYPFVFDCPDFHCHAHLALPAFADAQVTAFAHEVEVYESDADCAAAWGDEVVLAARSFLPSGLFTPDGESTEPPQALAVFSGHVLRAEKRRNDLTDIPFWWALVDTYGGIFDVVIDPALLPIAPTVGGVLSGSFWLSGRLLAPCGRRPALYRGQFECN